MPNNSQDPPVKTDQPEVLSVDPLTPSTSGSESGPLTAAPASTSPVPDLPADQTAFLETAETAVRPEEQALAADEPSVMAETGQEPPEKTPLPPEFDPVQGTGNTPTMDSFSRPVLTDAPVTTSTTFSAPELPVEKPKPGFFKKLLVPLIILLIILITGGVVYRFVLPGTQRPGEANLTYWGLWEPEEVMKPIIDDWNQKNPGIKVNYIRQSPKEYRERLQSALARNEGPDIFRFHATWVPMFKNDLDPIPAGIMSPSDFESSFYPVAKQLLRSGNNYLGIPLHIDTLALFINQDIFEAGGRTAPANWIQLRQTAFDLTTKNTDGRLQTAGAALGLAGNVDHWSDILALMILQNGGDLSRPNDKLAQDAISWFTQFSRVDNVWDNTMPNSTTAFATGRLAMYFGFSWDVFEVKELNKNLRFKVVPVPQLPGNEVYWSSFWVEGVSKNSPNRLAAWEFLKYLSSLDVMQKMYTQQSKIRDFGEIYSRKDLSKNLLSNPLVAPFVNQADKATSGYLCSRTFDNGLNDGIIKYYEDAVNAINKGSVPAGVLETAATGVTQKLSQYGLVANNR